MMEYKDVWRQKSKREGDKIVYEMVNLTEFFADIKNAKIAKLYGYDKGKIVECEGKIVLLIE